MRKKPKCGNKCPYWHFSLRFPVGLGPVCKKWNLPINAARDKCFALTGTGRGRKRTNKEIEKPQQQPKIQANPWQGVYRGWGAITK